MDRSVLSDERLVTASRDFVCVRLATYEDKAEAEFLVGVFRGRSGELENTVFALFAPDGKTRISRAGRSPDMVFGRDESGMTRLLAEMKEIATKYPAKKSAAPAPLPRLKSLRLALNVAACDHLPLAVVVRGSKADSTFEKTLAELAWSEELRGRLTWATADVAEAKSVFGRDLTVGLHIIAPDTFGLEGATIASATAKSDRKKLAKVIGDAIAKYEPKVLEHRDHVMTGKRSGKDWKTAVPVTDPGNAPPGRGEGPPPGGDEKPPRER